MGSENQVNLDSMSRGMGVLVQGYIDYSKEVIAQRALASRYDGLKPVNRAILFSAMNLTKKGKTKSARVVGDVIGTYHPHGDTSTYEALVLLTSDNGSMSVPVLSGDSNFGNVLSSDRAAAMRYTEVQISEDALKYYCQEFNGVRMIPTFDGSSKMPEEFPVSFPAVLCNSQEGVAVGFRGKMPSFNLLEVLGLVEEYINEGSCSTVIAPDFVTGGYFVKNNKELQKLMSVGKAKFQLRGLVEVQDKIITLREFPFGKTNGGLVTQISNLKLNGVKEVRNSSGIKGIKVTVECKSVAVVQEVLNQLYKKTDLQCTFSADLTTIVNGAPVTSGVWGIIEDWVKWRREVIRKDYMFRHEGLLNSMRQANAFITLFRDAEKCDMFRKIVVEQGKAPAADYLLKNFDNSIIDYELAMWLTGRRLSDFHKGGKYLDEYESCMREVKYVESIVENPDILILSQCKEMKAEKRLSNARRTQISTMDFNFVESEKEVQVVIDNSVCYYTLVNNFLRKYRFEYQVPKGVGYIKSTASVTLLGVDNRGRVIRVYCADIPFTDGSAVGVYLPTYLGIEETEDYAILYLDLLTGDRKLIIYNDGYIGFLDTSEWADSKKQLRVVNRGIDAGNADKVAGIVPFNESDWICAVDSSGRIAVETVRSIKQMSRTARKKVFDMKGSSVISSFAVMSEMDGYGFLRNPGAYIGSKFKHLQTEGDLIGDTSILQQSIQ